MTQLNQTDQASNRNMIVVSYNVLAKGITQTTIRNIKSKVKKVLGFLPLLVTLNSWRKKIMLQGRFATSMRVMVWNGLAKMILRNTRRYWKRFFTSNKLNIDKEEYICNLEHNKYKLQHKKDSSLTVDIWSHNNVEHEVKQQHNEFNRWIQDCWYQVIS